MEYIFWTSLTIVFHTFLLYPVILKVLYFFKKKNYKQDFSYQPTISIIISAYNEEKVIKGTIVTLLKSDYNQNKIEILIGSDDSTDNTNIIVGNLAKENNLIKFFPFNTRRGKAQVLNDLISKASNEILIFCDANTIYHPEAIKRMCSYYVNEEVCGVSGRLVLNKNKEYKAHVSLEEKYWSLESWLKHLEGSMGMLIGANGGIYSIRRKFFVPIPSTHPVMDDFYISLKVLEQDKDFFYDKNALAYEYVSPNLKIEFNRKVRNNSIDLSTIKSISKLLNPAYGLKSYFLWSHKILRWFTSLFLILLIVSNIFLFSYSDFYATFLFAQIAFYVIAGFGYLTVNKFEKFNLPGFAFYFVLTNIAMFVGIVKFLTGRHTSHWQSTSR